MTTDMPGGLLVDASAGDRPVVTFRLDGVETSAREGQSLLAAILSVQARLRSNEFTGEPRAGFCAMGSCHDCWVWLPEGGVRACVTPVRAGCEVSTHPPRGE